MSQEARVTLNLTGGALTAVAGTPLTDRRPVCSAVKRAVSLSTFSSLGARLACFAGKHQSLQHTNFVTSRAHQGAAVLLIGCAALTIAPRAIAQGNTQTLQEVTVTGNLEAQVPFDLQQVGVQVDSISIQQIQNNAYIDTAGALEYQAPGLYLTSKNGPFDYVNASLLGSRTEDILWLVDGVRINNRLYAGTTPLDTMPAAMIQQIQVLQGGQALFYGTEAVAGVVNIITKSFSNTAGGDLSIGADTNDGRHFDGFARDAIGPNQFVLYASGDKSPGFRPFREQDYQPSGTDRRRAYDVLTIGGKYARQFGHAVRVSVDEQHTDARLDFARPYLFYTEYNERAEDLVTAKVDATLNENVEIFVKPYYHLWHSHVTEINNTIPPSSNLVLTQNHLPWGYVDYGANALAKLDFGRYFEYFAGYDLQRYGGSDASLVITQHDETTNAVFAQIRTSPKLFPKLRLAVGARFNEPSVGQSATVWNASGKYSFGAGMFLQGQAGSAFRLPTAEELFANDPNDERGNPNLKPETSNNANLSLGQDTELGSMQASWEVTAFYRDVRDLIDYISFDAATNQSVFGNIPGTIHMKGGEVTLDVAPTPFVTGHLDFTYSHSIDPTTGRQIERVPDKLLKFQLDLHPTTVPLGATATVQHVGTVYQTGLWDGTESYGNYWVFNLAGRWFLDPERHNRLDLSLENVTNRVYATGLGTGVRDVDGSNYTYWDLGVPRTLRLEYTYSF